MKDYSYQTSGSEVIREKNREETSAGHLAVDKNLNVWFISYQKNKGKLSQFPPKSIGKSLIFKLLYSLFLQVLIPWSIC